MQAHPSVAIASYYITHACTKLNCVYVRCHDNHASTVTAAIATYTFSKLVLLDINIYPIT